MLNPMQRARHLKRTTHPPGVVRSKPRNTARGTPGDRHFVMTTTCGLSLPFVHRITGCQAPPAFRAPSDFQFDGEAKLTRAHPAPTKQYGRRSVGFLLAS